MRTHFALIPSCVIITLATLTAVADTTIDPIIDELAMFGINRDNGRMSRYHFNNGATTDVGYVTRSDGHVYTGIDASAYIPGHQNIIAFVNDPATGMARMVYVDIETAVAATVGNDLGAGKVGGAVAAQSTGNANVSGLININPNNSPQNEFTLVTNSGLTITRDDLHQDTNVDGSGVFFEGDAGYTRVKPKGNGQQNGLYINFEQIILQNSNTYTITGEMSVKVFNDHIHSNGKAMGKWWLQINPSQAVVLSDGMAISGGESSVVWSVYAVQKIEDQEDEPVDFVITDDTVVPSEPFAAKVTVLGAAITASGQYNVPVTTRMKVGSTTYEPFGDFDKAVSGNVNDNNNPRSYIFPNIYPAGTSIDVLGRSWLKRKSWYSGNSNNHWYTFMTIDGSNYNTQQLKVLRNGDNVPDIDGFMNQDTIVDFIEDYINSDTQKVVLDENQAIYLYELGTTNMSSSAADFQDLVVLVTLAKDPSDFDEGDDDDDTVGAAARLLKVNHKTGGYAQVMTVNRVYDGLATTDGSVFYASIGRELYKLDVVNQTETLIGTLPGPSSAKHFGLEFAGSTLISFEIAGDKIYPINALTGSSLGSGAGVGMDNAGTITFMPRSMDPAATPKDYD